MIRRLLLVGLLAVLAGCAQVSKVAAVADGTVTVRDKLVVVVPDEWNQFERGPIPQATTWTHEGIFVDALQFWVGLKDGDLIAPTPNQPAGLKPLAFKAGMQTAELADLLQGLWTRDGSVFTLEGIEPHTFVGTPGFRLRYSLVRKIDEVRMRGVAWGAVRNGELFLISYTAPRLAFFPRGVADAEAVARSARVR
jgi:hypothetical protein